jgi:MFS family permease
MSTYLNLKEIERKAFRSTFQDGLLDIYISSVVGSMALLMYIIVRDDYPWLYLVLAFLGLAAGNLVFWVGKRFITMPRMGQVKFGGMRRRRHRNLALILAVFVLLQVSIVLLTAGVWAIPAWGDKLQELFPDRNATILLVAALGALFVGPSIMVIAYFSDFLRGYYIALVMSVGVFLMIWLGQPLFQVGAAFLILIPGLVLLVRFLRQYPLHPAGD